jgi:hypothetical protein
MKTLNRIICAAAFAVAASLVNAADTYNLNSVGVPVINSASSSTNVVVGYGQSAWPNSIAASTSVTNVTKLDVSAGLHTSIQFDASATQTNGGAVIIQLARSIYPGATQTNALGTGMRLDLFATVTNTLPANTATANSTVCNLFGPVIGQSYNGDGAIPNFYIYSITTPANVTLTNYAVSYKVQ